MQSKPLQYNENRQQWRP